MEGLYPSHSPYTYGRGSPPSASTNPLLKRNATQPKLHRGDHVALHRRLRDAGTRGERLFGGVLERLIRRQHHRGRAHLVVRRIDAGRRDAFRSEERRVGKGGGA